jgi:hypothetical protein
MKLIEKVPWLAVVVLLCATQVNANFDYEITGVTGEVKVLSKPSGPSGPLQLWYRFGPNEHCPQCSTLTFRVGKHEGIGINGPLEWMGPVSIGHPYEGILNLDIPANDTTMLEVFVESPCPSGMILAYFVSIGDSVEFHDSQIRPADPRSRQQRNADSLEAALSEEQLNYEYDIKVYLGMYSRRPPERLLQELERLRPLTGQLAPTDTPYVYSGRTTRRAILEMTRRGCSFNVVSGEYPDIRAIGRRLFQPHPEELRFIDSMRATDSLARRDRRTLDSLLHLDSGSAPQGSLPPSDRGTGQITLNHVDCMSSGKIFTRVPVTFYFDVYNNTGRYIGGITNGFRAYSPDGADWSTTRIDTGSGISWESYFDLFTNLVEIDVDGHGSDTVGYGFCVQSSSGLPNGTLLSSAWTVTIGPISDAHAGDIFCVDSCYYPPMGIWKWSASNPATGFYPAWGGPYCYEATPPQTISVSGYIGYQDPVPPTVNTVWLDSCYVEMWDFDDGEDADDLLSGVWTDNSGHMQQFDVDNADVGGSALQDIYFKVYAWNSWGEVWYDDDALIREFKTLPDWNVSNGSHSYNAVVPADSAGPFFIVDNVVKSYDAWNDLSPENSLGYVTVVLKKEPPSAGAAGYDTLHDYIYINDSTYGPAGQWSAAFWEWTLHHEYGHRISRNTDFFDASPGGTHQIDGIYSLELAASEGWSQFWAATTMDTNVLVNYWNNWTKKTWLNLENGEYSSNGSLAGSLNARGRGNEGSVAGILWDIFDFHEDDYSSSVDWGTLNLGPCGDGVGDQLFLGFGDIIENLLDETYDNHHPDNMDEFWYCWFDPLAKYLYQEEMSDIFYEHGDGTHTGCCYGVTGNINGDEDESIDVSDIVYLVAFMFQGGPPPPCMDEGDINGSGAGPDISDLIYFSTYMFQGGPPPAVCD